MKKIYIILLAAVLSAGLVSCKKDSIGGTINRSDVTSPKKESLAPGNGRQKGAFAVGVRSAGPDKKWDTVDDISTFPEEVN